MLWDIIRLCGMLTGLLVSFANWHSPERWERIFARITLPVIAFSVFVWAVVFFNR